MEFFLLSKKPFTEKRDINWRKVKIVLGAMIAALVFALLLLPEEEQLGSFAEVSNKDSEMKSETPNYYDDPNIEAIKYFKTSNLGSVPRSLGHNYQSGASSANNRNDSMIINRDGANAKNELSAGHRIIVSLLDRIVISNQAMPVRAKVVENIASDNYLAIEAQSILIGDATFDEANGLAQITWKTIIYPNGVQRSISASGANSEGRFGVSGRVESEGIKNAVGQTVTRFVGAYAEGSMSKGAFGASEGGHKNGVKNAVAHTAVDSLQKMGEEIQKERKWIVLEKGQEFYAMLNQSFVFRNQGSEND